MKLIKIVILWVFAVTILHLISLSAPGMENSEGILFFLVMLISAIFIITVGYGLDWKGLGEKKREKRDFDR